VKKDFEIINCKNKLTILRPVHAWIGYEPPFASLMHCRTLLSHF
jgi:hypothetical protein